MSVIDCREKPVIKLIDFLSVFHRIKIRCVHRLEFSELYFYVIGQSVIIVIDCLFLSDIYKGGSGCSSGKVRICILVELA